MKKSGPLFTSCFCIGEFLLESSPSAYRFGCKGKYLLSTNRTTKSGLYVTVASFQIILYTRADSPYGGHGEKVITGVCGTSITGSIPVDRPTKLPKLAIYLCFAKKAFQRMWIRLNTFLAPALRISSNFGSFVLKNSRIAEGFFDMKKLRKDLRSRVQGERVGNTPPAFSNTTPGFAPQHSQYTVGIVKLFSPQFGQ